ncbi:MAG: hypothetical protein K6D59_06920 [Bacteroidales bacterium]|nr:hypothetical protein [Bacteroidales bacterium]
MKIKLLFVLLWFCATGVSAQRLTVKNYQEKTPPPSMVKIADNVYCDQAHITNVDWLEYLYWLEHVYGKESSEYRAALPEEQIIRQQLPDSIAQNYSHHPAYRTFPVLGISHPQARAYCEWRTDRIAEWMLVHLGREKFSSNQSPDNYFSIKKGGMPADLKTLYFFLPSDKVETRYGFVCFAEWR